MDPPKRKSFHIIFISSFALSIGDMIFSPKKKRKKKKKRKEKKIGDMIHLHPKARQARQNSF